MFSFNSFDFLIRIPFQEKMNIKDLFRKSSHLRQLIFNNLVIYIGKKAKTISSFIQSFISRDLQRSKKCRIFITDINFRKFMLLLRGK